MDGHFARSQGFTLLEVLVALLILLVGLLGIAGLMSKGQRASYEAYQRQQALALAMDIAEKIRANQGAAPYYKTGVTDGPNMPGQGGKLNDLTTAAITDCMTATCGKEDIAKYDLATWDGLLVGATETSGATRVGGILNPRGCVEWNGDTAAPVFVVSVSWQGESDTGAPTASACGSGLYGSDARRRLVTLNVASCRLNAAAPWGCAP